MKYIKLFEEAHSYYHETTDREYVDHIHQNIFIELGINEVEFIESLIDPSYDFISHSSRIISIMKDKITIDIIIKLPDEYFCVKFNNKTSRTNDEAFKYYKCDQIDGLIELLKNQGIIK